VILTRKGKPLAAVKDLSGIIGNLFPGQQSRLPAPYIEEARRSYSRTWRIGIDEVVKNWLGRRQKGRKKFPQKKKKR